MHKGPLRKEPIPSPNDHQKNLFSFQPSRFLKKNSFTTPSSKIQKPVPTSQDFCNIHKKSIELFCVNCKSYLCSDCTVFSNHFQHKIITSRECDNLSDTKLENQLNDVNNLKSELTKKTILFKNEMQINHLQLNTELQSIFADILRQVEKHRQHLVERIQGYFEAVGKSLNRKKEKFDNIIFQINSKLKTNFQDSKSEIDRDIDVLREKIQKFSFPQCTPYNLKLLLENNYATFFKQMVNLNCELNQVYQPSPDEEDNLFIESIHDPFMEPERRRIPNNLSFDRKNVYDENKLINKSLTYKTIDKNLNVSVDYKDLSNNIYAQSESKGLRNKLGNKKQVQPDTPNSRINLQLGANMVYSRENLGQRTFTMNNIKTKTNLLNNFSTKKVLNLSTIEMNTPFDDSEKLRYESQRGLSVSSRRDLSMEIPKSKIFSESFSGFVPSLNFSKKNLPIEKLILIFLETKINGPVKTLNLSQNLICDLGLKQLLKNLVNLSFCEIDLSTNDLGPNALDYLISFSNYNSSVKLINLQGNYKIDSTEESVKEKIVFLKSKGIKTVL